MSTTTNTPIIVKRKKIVAAAGHHGGAWKVAYADFVTAMMAFFMLMWLLSATTEQQRAGLADYFSPDIPIARVSGGGNGMLSGREEMAGDSIAPRPQVPLADTEALETLEQIESEMFGKGGESLVSDDIRRHVVTKVTDEGLVIELFDMDGAQLFAPGTADPQPLARLLASSIARALATVENNVALTAHIRSDPITLSQGRAWPLTMERADSFRRLLDERGLETERMRRATGKADRELAVRDPMSPRNDRIEVILLRKPSHW